MSKKKSAVKDAKAIDGRELMAFSRMVRACLLKRGLPARVADEVESMASLVVLKTHAKTGYPLAGHRSYYFVAATRQVAAEIKHTLAPYRIGGRLANLGIFTLPQTYQVDPQVSGVNHRRAPMHRDDDDSNVGECMASAAAPPPTPEDLLVRAEAEQARARLMRRLLAHSQAMPADTRRNVAHLLREVVPGVKVPRKRPTRNAAWNGVVRLRNLVAKNELARRDRDLMTGRCAA